MKRWLTIVMAVGTLSCAESVGPETKTDLLRVNVFTDQLQLVNLSQQPIYFFVIERNSLLDWAPCVDPGTCEAIAVGGSKMLSYTEIAGYQVGATEAVVHHWLLVPQGSEFQPDSIRSPIVHLHAH
jgi:hypothetical protein